MAVSGREKTDMRQSVDIYRLYTIYIVYLFKKQREEKQTNISRTLICTTPFNAAQRFDCVCLLQEHLYLKKLI